MSEFKLKKLEIDENGLIKNLKYHFTEEGLVDWKSMIPVKYLYINNDIKNRARIEKKYNKNYNQIDIINDKVEDSDLVQLLAGVKFLLKIRRYLDIKYTIKEANENYAAVNCRIVYAPNFESQNQPIAFEDNACAHGNNTNGFGQQYLLEMATNRALCRCVRSFLSINIVSKEELQNESNDNFKSNGAVENNFAKVLSELMVKKKIDWPKIADKLKKENLFKEQYTGPDTLPTDILVYMIGRLKKIKDIV